MEERLENVVGMSTVTLSRIAALENRTIPLMKTHISEHERDLLEIRRRLGDDAALSLKASRGPQEDVPMGLAALSSPGSPMFDVDDVDAPETSAITAIQVGDLSESSYSLRPRAVDVQQKIQTIEAQIAAMKERQCFG